MNQVEINLPNGTQIMLRKILDFLIGFLGSLLIANIGVVLVGQFNPPKHVWISFFIWFWRLAFMGLAVFLISKKRIGISIGLVAAILLQAFGIWFSFV